MHLNTIYEVLMCDNLIKIVDYYTDKTLNYIIVLNHRMSNKYLMLDIINKLILFIVIYNLTTSIEGPILFISISKNKK